MAGHKGQQSEMVTFSGAELYHRDEELQGLGSRGLKMSKVCLVGSSCHGDVESPGVWRKAQKMDENDHFH